MKAWSACWATLWLLALGGLATRADVVSVTNFKDLPVLTNGPGKGCYALFQGKLFDVQVTTNLDLLVYPVENGKRLEPPIEIYNSFTTLGSGLKFIGAVKPDPPSLNPQKLVFRVVTDQGAQLVQTWKFSDGLLSASHLFKDYTGTVPSMHVVVKFPPTPTLKPDASAAERSAATTGCALRWRAGRSDAAMKIITVPYDHRVLLQDYCDWMEHKGPWGSRKITLKRTTSKGLLSLAGSVYGYEGVIMLFITRFDPLKRGELQGFDLKVE